jgi:type II secretory pathway pseudopilin PulG
MHGRPRAEAGYTYLMLLFGVAAMGLFTAVAAESWGTLAQRERERELLFAGNQYREALRRYYEAIPDAAERYPRKLEELLEDTRFAGTRHHLRQIYSDPMTGQADWVLLRQGPYIVGLHSRATGKPFKQGGFEKRDADFAGAASYADWKFAAASNSAGTRTGAITSRIPGAGATSPTGSVASHLPVARP